MQLNVTDKLLDRICSIVKAELSDNVIQQVKKCLIDYLGCTFAGAKINNTKTEEFINNLSSFDADCIILGTDFKTNLFNSVIANGYNSHILELDDGHRFGMMHVGSPVFSALIPVAQKENVSKDVFFKSVVCGYEAAVLSSKAMQPSHKKRGYHTTGTCGTIGAAVACAVAMELCRGQIKTAIDCAVTSAAGLLELQEDSSQLKPYNVARAALDGVSAAYMAKTGFIGPNDSLGGKRGLFSVLSDEYDDSIFDNLNDTYEIENVYFKIYASCRHCHSPIEAALNIKKKNNVEFDDIKKVEIYTYKLAIFGHDHTEINSESSAKMSIPFSVAVALFTDSAGIDKYTEKYFSNTKIIDFMSKIDIIEDKELTALCPAKRAAKVEITLKNGQVFSSYVDYSKGEPENPITDDELKNKFSELIEFGGFGKNYSDSIINLLEK